MAIVAKFIDNKIIAAGTVDAAISELIRIKLKFKTRIRTDYANMTSPQLTDSARSADMVKYANYKIVELQQFRNLNLNINSSSAALMAIHLKNRLMNTGCEYLHH